MTTDLQGQKLVKHSKKIQDALYKAYQEALELANVPDEYKDSASASRADVERKPQVWFFVGLNDKTEYSVDLRAGKK